jgi:hypothetical protein
MRWTNVAVILYEAGALCTWLYLMFFDGYRYNAFNWIVALAVNSFNAAIWPFYWLIIRPLYHFISGG